MKSQNIIITLLAVLGLGLGFWVANQPSRANIVGVLPQAKVITAFNLQNSAGGEFTKQNFNDKLSVISFGYTNCPDICPSTLAQYQATKKLLSPELAQKTQFIFISVDPKRDSLEVLNDYVKYFDNDFVGLTASDTSLHLFAKQLFASYIEPDTTATNYEVGHSAYLHIVNQDAKFTAIVKPPINTKQLVSLLVALDTI